MKRKLLSTALIAILGIGITASVAACDNDEKGYEISITNKSELQERWSVGDPTRYLSFDLEPVANATEEITKGNLTIASSDSSVVGASGATISALGTGTATITATWHGVSDSVELTVSPAQYKTIKSINEGIANGTIVDGDTIRVYGRIIASMQQNSTHVSSGVYLGDGEDTLMLYSGQLSSYWTSLDLKLGDEVCVAAKVSKYNGFYEFQPSLIVRTTDAEEPEEYASIADTPVTVIDDYSDWEALTCYNVGLPVEMTLTYKSGSISSNSSHGTLYFDLYHEDEDDVDEDADEEVIVYCNYHNGTDEQGKLMKLAGDLDVGDVVTITGVVSWYNTYPELCPQFMLVDGEEITPSDGFVIAPKPATTSLVITGDNVTETSGDTQGSVSLECYFSLQLSAKVDEGADKSVEWSISATDTNTLDANEVDPSSIATISDTGFVRAWGVGSVTVTCTATKAPEDGTAASDSITLTVTALTHTTPFCTTTEDNTYYFGFEMNEEMYYIDGTYPSGYAYEPNLTTDTSKAVSVTVNAVSGSDRAFTLSFTVESTTYYIAIVTSGTHVNVNYVETETPIYWSYELECFTDYDETHFLCYNSAYKCLYCSDVASYYGSSEPALLYKTSYVATKTEVVQSYTSGSSYYLGIDTGNGKYFLNGEMSGYYGATVSSYKNAIQFTVTDESSPATCVKVSTTIDGKTVYVSAAVSGTYVNFSYSETETALTWDSTYHTFTTTVGEDATSPTHFLGSYGDYTTIGWYAYSYISNSGEYPLHLYQIAAQS